MRRFVILLFLACILNLNSQSKDEVLKLQDSLGLYPQKFGAFFNYSIPGFNVNFNSLPGIPFNNKGFTDISASGMNFGAFWYLPLSKKLSLNSKVSYSLLSGSFKSVESELTQKVPDTVWTFIENLMEPNLPSVNINPNISYEVIDNFNISAGINISLFVSPTFNQHEKILNDNAPDFSNGSRENNVYKNEPIPNISSIYLSIPLGVEYNYSFSNNYLLGLNVSYNLGLGSLVSGIDWSLSSINLGVSIAYETDRPCPPGMYRNADGNCEWAPCPPGMVRNSEGECVCREGMILNSEGLCVWPPCPERNYKRNENGECVQVLFADIKVQPILPSGLPSDNEQIYMRESESMVAQSLLNYIFFDENSYEIPKRYKVWQDDSKIGNFKEENIINFENPVETYYNILNIIGYRMSNSPFAKLTLVTYNLPGVEKDNSDLPLKRVETIANYLKNIWKVPEYRIETKIYNLPPELAKMDNKYLLDEYRRVEIIPDTSNMDIIEPLFKTNLVFKAYPPKININLDVIPLTSIEQWALKIKQKEKVYFEEKGKEKPPSLITWYPNLTSYKYDYDLGPIEVEIELKDKSQVETKNSKPLQLSWINFDKNAEPEDIDSVYSLYYLLFNFNDDNIERDIRKNSEILDNIIFDKYRSRFNLTGFTDNIGDEKANKILSNKRVEAVSKYLIEKNKVNESHINKLGLGSIELFNNELPEGRFYNRIVTLQISTPRQKAKSQDIKFEGCYVIVYSDENELNAKSIYDILVQKGINDVFIEKYIEEALDKTFYRVRTKFYKEVREAVIARAKISVVIKQMNLKKPPSIKCSQ